MKEIQGKVIRHRCDNPACVNPNHLEVGTQADNMKDMYQRGRRAIGEKSGASKLTLSQVEEIKKRYEKHSRTNGTGALSVEFGVCRAAIWNVVKGHSWSTDAE